MKEKAFAVNVCRETIREREKVGPDLGTFSHIDIEAVTEIKEQMDLS